MAAGKRRVGEPLGDNFLRYLQKRRGTGGDPVHKAHGCCAILLSKWLEMRKTLKGRNWVQALKEGRLTVVTLTLEPSETFPIARKVAVPASSQIVLYGLQPVSTKGSIATRLRSEQQKSPSGVKRWRTQQTRSIFLSS